MSTLAEDLWLHKMNMERREEGVKKNNLLLEEAKRRITAEEELNELNKKLEATANYIYRVVCDKEGRNLLFFPEHLISQEGVHAYIEEIRIHINSRLLDQIKTFNLSCGLSTYGADMPREIITALFEARKKIRSGALSNLLIEQNEAIVDRGDMTKSVLATQYSVSGLNGNHPADCGSSNKASLDLFLSNPRKSLFGSN